MQGACATLLLLSFVAAPVPTAASRATKASVPAIGKVLGEILELQSKFEGEAKLEQKEYDKYACWCEKTLQKKAMEIDELTKLIIELQAKILKYKGILGVYSAEIMQLDSSIKANIKLVIDAKSVRGKKAEAYEAEKAELEQCIGALEAAINALSGAGEKDGEKKASLVSVRQAEAVGAAAGIKDLLANPRAIQMVSAQDLKVMEEFVEKPSEFLQGQRGAVGFLDAQANPFGDYQPKSGQIQGILKEMYDQFCKDLEKANVEEAEGIRIHNKLIEVKKEEEIELKKQFKKFNVDNGDIVQKLSSATSELDISKKALKEAKEYFAEVKQGCKEKATAWSVRTKLRTEQLLGIQEALDILKSPESKKLFSGEGTFLQIAAPHLKVHKRVTKADIEGHHAYDRLSALATKYGTLSLANLAAEVKLSGGHFDKVIAMINKLIFVLKNDQKDDDAHKAYCESEIKKNEAEKKELKKLIEKTGKAIELMKEQIDELEEDIAHIAEKIKSTKKELKEISDTKTAETKEYNLGAEQNRVAMKILAMASEAIAKFYRANGLVLMHTATYGHPAHWHVAFHLDSAAGAPSTPVSETNWDKTSMTAEDAEGAKGILGILESLMDDIKKDMSLAKSEEDESMKTYQETRQKMIDEMDTDQELSNTKSHEMAVLEKKMSFAEEDLQQAHSDKDDVEKVLESLAEECEWVKTHYEKRKEKRDTEIEGLKEAKMILMGAGVKMG